MSILTVTLAQFTTLVGASALVPGAQYAVSGGLFTALTSNTFSTASPATGTIADMLAATVLRAQQGAQFAISSGSVRSLWIADRDNAATPAPAWKPVNSRCCIAARQGAVAHPVSGPNTGAVSGTFTNKIVLSASLLYPGTRLNYRGRFRKVGNNGTATVTVNIGTAGNATDTLLWTGTFAATGGPRELLVNTNADVYDATTITTEAQTGLNVDQLAVATDQTTNFNCASAMTVSVSWSAANVADNFVLENQFLYFEAF